MALSSQSSQYDSLTGLAVPDPEAIAANSAVQQRSAPPGQNDSRAWLVWSNGRFRAGDHEAAISGFDTVLAADPDCYDAWYRRGISLYALKRYAEALESFDRSLEIDPNACNARGWRNQARQRVYVPVDDSRPRSQPPQPAVGDRDVEETSRSRKDRDPQLEAIVAELPDLLQKAKLSGSSAPLQSRPDNLLAADFE